MNVEHERELMVFVERIVRPIVAPEQTKLRMRRELLSHALDAAHQEQSRQADDATAVRQAITRLGDPEEARRELQQTVSFAGYCEGVIERFLRQQPGQSLLWHTVRVPFALATALVLTYAVVFWIADSLASLHNRATHTVVVSLAAAVASLMLLPTLVLLTKSCSTVLNDWWACRLRFGRALRLPLLAFGVLALSAACLRTATERSDVLLHSLQTAAVMIALLTPLAAITAGLDAWRRRGVAEWAALDLNPSIANPSIAE